MLPRNPDMLLSIVNMKLRDFYRSLDELCDDLDESRDELEHILKRHGYIYDDGTNRFVQT